MSIENTSNREPLGHLLGMLGGSDSYITGMESAGQAQLLNSSQLPAKGPWDELEALGFVLGEPVPGDDLFVNATLPAGWSKQGSDHAMNSYSYIVDERGVRRVSVFYKAAFYDRRADLGLINVGWDRASKLIYSDDPVALPDDWAILTDAERAEFAKSIRSQHELYTTEDYYVTHRPENAKRTAAALALLAVTE